MVYNNPVSYSVDITPEMFADLADVDNVVAIKESSDNVRRLTDITNVTGGRYTLFSGVDDLVHPVGRIDHRPIGQRVGADRQKHQCLQVLSQDRTARR